VAGLAVVSAVRYIALYLRISKDKTGRVEGVGRQEKWGRTYVEQAITSGLLPDLPIRVFKDNDVSAFDDDAHRPDYDALRDAIRRGEVEAIWTVEQTRLEANRRRWVEFTVEADEAGIREIHTNRDGLVLLEVVADIKAVLSWHERKRLRERVHDTLKDMADEGRPHGGVAFGYDWGKDTDGRPTRLVNDVEASALWFMANAIDLGWSQASISRALNTITLVMKMCGHRGIPPKLAGHKRKDGTPIGWAWNTTKVKQCLRSPVIAGFLTHKGKIHRRGTWEPILDEVTWRRVGAKLDRPRTVTRPDGKVTIVGGNVRPARKFKLTGYVFCGRDECGHNLTGRRDQAGNGAAPRPIYFCLKDRAETNARGRGCSRLAINAEPLEAEFERRFLGWLSTDEFRAQFAVDRHEGRREELDRDLADIDRQHVKLAMRWGRGEMPDEAWDAARAELDERAARARAELAAIPAPAARLDPHEIVASWEHLSMDEQRQVIGLYVSRIVVFPAKPGVGRFDPGRVVVYDINGNVVPA
jgi:site-specific DNA recombinase